MRIVAWEDQEFAGHSITTRLIVDPQRQLSFHNVVVSNQMPRYRHERSAIIRTDLGDDAPWSCELGI
jgi:hypothetical protein